MGTSAETDEALAARARAGDRAAFGELVARFALPLAAFARRRLGDPEESTDVAQATFVRALETIGGLREPRAVRGWLYGIALNECRRRRRGIARLETALRAWLDHRSARERAALDPDEGDVARAALAELPERQRLAVELRVLEGLTCDEAALALGCTTGTVKANLHHGLAKLRARLGGDA